MWQIPFINQAPFVSYTKINFYIYTKLLHIFLPCGIYIAYWNIERLLFTHALLQNSLFQGSAPFWSLFVWILVRISSTRYSETLLLKLDTDAYNVDKRKRCLTQTDFFFFVSLFFCDFEVKWFQDPASLPKREIVYLGLRGMVLSIHSQAAFVFFWVSRGSSTALVINNYSSSPNGFLVNSPWGRRSNELLTQRLWVREE